MKQDSVRVSILSHDLSINCAARALSLKSLLVDAFPTRLIGPRFGDAVWSPFRRMIPPEDSVPAGPFPRFLWTMSRLEKMATGEVLYAAKPRMASYGIALRMARRRGCPVLLDMDDDESELFAERGWIRRVVSYRNPNGYAWTRRLGRSIPVADAITTGSPSLARKYGGTFIPYAVDSRAFDPANFDPAAEKRKLGLDGKFLIVFCGSPRPHKGLDVLSGAIGTLASIGAHLLLIGDVQDPAAVADLTERSRGRITIHPPIARSEVPRFLSAADTIVIPQRDTPYARMQVPAKLFDAMASGKPVIASRVSDIPAVLDGTGVLVPPGDVSSLARAIRTMANDLPKGRVLGRQSRDLFRAQYDSGVIRDRLASIVMQAWERSLVRSGQRARA